MSPADQGDPSPPNTERPEQRIFTWIIAGCAVLGVVGGILASVYGKPARPKLPQAETAADSLPRELADFSLQDRTGRTVTRADLTNQYLIVNFVFTSCSLSCLAVNHRMHELQELTRSTRDVRLVSITVDPRTDSPPVLARFADRFQADPEHWLFLTGDQTPVYQLIESSFLPPVPELASVIPGGFANTERIMLVDPKGTVWASFNGLKPDVAATIQNEINSHRQASRHP